jgi:3-mercaptopyruvate sulfurtransferase SseA
MNRSKYVFEQEGSFVFIEDLDEGKSVTNDVENVVRDLAEEGIDVDRSIIVYKDTSGTWDGILCRDGKFFAFRAIGAKSREQARNHILEALS